MVNYDKYNLNKDSRAFFETVCKYKHSLEKKAKLIFDRKFTSGNIVFDIENRIKILVNQF